jgi:hypothetical protein
MAHPCRICTGLRRWSYGFYILLAVPIIPFAVTTFAGALAWAWRKRANDPEGKNPKSRQWKGIHLDFMCRCRIPKP